MFPGSSVCSCTASLVFTIQYLMLSQVGIAGNLSVGHLSPKKRYASAYPERVLYACPSCTVSCIPQFRGRPGVRSAVIPGIAFFIVGTLLFLSDVYNVSQPFFVSLSRKKGRLEQKSRNELIIPAAPSVHFCAFSITFLHQALFWQHGHFMNLLDTILNPSRCVLNPGTKVSPHFSH